MRCCLAMGCAAQRGVRHGAGRQVRCHGQRQHRHVRSGSAADVTVHPCMFKRAGYAFAGWNTEEDGTGTWYWVNGVPVTDWRDGDTVELYAQWKKTAAQRPVVDSDPVDPADPFDPDVPPAELDELFGVDPDAAFDADPDPLPEELDDAFGVDPGGDTDAPLPS